MGKGYEYNCRKCQHKYSVSLGTGMLFPEAYHSIIYEIADGKYGTEWKAIYDSTPYAAVNAGKEVYICKHCSRWEEGTDISLYAPNNPDIISQKRYGEKTVRELGYVPYVTAWDLKKDYHVLKRHYKRCSKCGKRMHKASEEELLNLFCPACGEKNRPTGFVRWD